MNFYKWNISEFETIAAYDLKVGDELAYGLGSKKLDMYGAVVVDSTSRTPGSILIHYTLPEGGFATCTREVEISVFFENNKTLIRISQDLPADRAILIRRK